MKVYNLKALNGQLLNHLRVMQRLPVYADTPMATDTYLYLVYERKDFAHNYLRQQYMADCDIFLVTDNNTPLACYRKPKRQLFINSLSDRQYNIVNKTLEKIAITEIPNLTIRTLPLSPIKSVSDYPVEYINIDRPQAPQLPDPFTEAGILRREAIDRLNARERAEAIDRYINPENSYLVP